MKTSTELIQTFERERKKEQVIQDGQNHQVLHEERRKKIFWTTDGPRWRKSLIKQPLIKNPN